MGLTRIPSILERTIKGHKKKKFITMTVFRELFSDCLDLSS